MSRFKKLLNMAASATVALSMALTMGLSGNVSADNPPCYQYNPNGFTTSTTPVFNNICGITSTLSSTSGNYPFGDETNFVRIRPHTSDNPLGADNPPLTNSLTSSCASGDKFDIWTYIHNNAEEQYNDNGSGSAVAHNVQLALAATQLNTTGNNFTFSSTVSADNAASTVSDSTNLTCNGQPVKLTLVKNSVFYNNNLNQTTYNSLPDSDVNSTFPVGSPVWPANGQKGDEWGCWNYRIVVVYTVEVQTAVSPQITATCDMFSVLANSDRKVTVNGFKFTAENVNFANAVIDWGDNSNNVTLTNASDVVNQTHQYTSNGPFNVSVLVNFSNGAKAGGPNSNCSQNVSFSGSTPTVTPPSSPPTELVNTGPGSVAGMFAAVTGAAAVLHRWYLGRRLLRK